MPRNLKLEDEIRDLVVQHSLRTSGRRLNRGLAARDVGYAAQRATSAAMQGVAAQAAAGARASASKQVADALTTVESTLKLAVGRRTKQKKMFEQVGITARNAVVDSYRRNFSKTISYRWEDSGRQKRYSNGQMLRALQSPEMFRAASDGLDFINAAFLDTKAKQWYRLNFGAGAQGRNEKADLESMTFFGQTLPGISLGEFQPGPKFMIPYGVFSETAFARTPDGDDRRKIPNRVRRSKSLRGQPFYLLAPPQNEEGGSGQVWFPTRGIEGKRFLEAGISSLNAEFPKAAERYAISLIEEASGQVKLRKNASPLAALFVDSSEATKQLKTLRRLAAK